MYDPSVNSLEKLQAGPLYIPATVVVACLRTVCPARTEGDWEIVPPPSSGLSKRRAPPAEPSTSSI